MATLNFHHVGADSFQLIKEAFPWRYQKVGNVEWVKLKYDGIEVTYFKA